ncbi:MAG: hypothetical protein ABF306_05470 [Nocardioides marinisabuli]|uniref:hypothetical protein n=1 Tax=Nocardioides marinisabuli TaxID=419476 RepID=UPI00321B6EA5
MREIPEPLRSGPFTRAQALETGLSSRMLQGQRFVRVHPGVWKCRDSILTWDQALLAARLALPERAHPTAETRLRMLGLDTGVARPFRFVVEGDHHLALDGIFLHRTPHLPPLDGDGVTPAAAFIALCARARVVDAIQVGDWLLHRDHMSLEELVGLALSAPWRDGAHEAVWVSHHLDARSRSLPESELRAVVVFAGLPTPEPNGEMELDGVTVIADLWFGAWSTAVEYEGAQHQEDRAVYVADLDRYHLFRGHGIGYVQVTKERLRHARTLVGTIHRELLAHGYDGPPPDVGPGFALLWQRLSRQVGPRRERSRGRRTGLGAVS